jgi:hypothetical protein
MTMSNRSRIDPKDVIAASVVLSSVALELTLRELYYRLSTELPRALMLALIWSALLLALFFIGRYIDPARHRLAGRLAVFIGLAAWLDRVGDAMVAWLMAVVGGHPPLIHGIVFALFVIGALFVLRTDDKRWSAWRRALTATALLFVASQPVVAAIGAPTISWPQAHSSEPGGRDVTVFLLLDELNASAAGPVVDALAKAGRGVTMKSLRPVGDGTAKVVPAMFSGRRFPDAKPCGLATVCSGTEVLAFSKVVASRPDVDVVGFFEPYCAISGLRSCVRLSPSSPLFDAARWRCAVWRRSTLLARWVGPDFERQCSELGGATWSNLVTGVEQAIELAPLWEQGGFLYAHVPLPHPPGLGQGTLASHYDANLARAVRLIDRIAARAAREPERRFTIVVFSDHPLRPAMWCGFSQYRRDGCPVPPHMIDDKVPLIVAGEVPKAFAAINENIDIFRLADR